MSYETQERMHLFHLHAAWACRGSQGSLSQSCSALNVQQRYLAPSPLAGKVGMGGEVRGRGHGSLQVRGRSRSRLLA
jgi:hypothetical protein